MRGTAASSTITSRDTGITPAHAGNSRGSAGKDRAARDHPRSCGEQFIYALDSRTFAGSPPLMRGTALIPLPPQPDHRITPAHAGNSFFPSSDKDANTDHPRSCGEQDHQSRSTLDSSGSPPLMRGTVAFYKMGQKWHRITPAHAGNSFYFMRYFIFPQDHPRSCGEQHSPPKSTVATVGSPPLMRGTAQILGCLPSPAGITPAHAGNSGA